MWTCPKCGNENEENFKFCWNCGLTGAKPEVAELPKPPEPPQPVKREIVRNEPEIQTEPEIKVKPPIDESDVLPMFARVSGIQHNETGNDDVSLERKIFTIAIRLVGLFLIYQVLVSIPDLAVMIYSALSNETADDTAANLFTGTFIIPAAKLLFYLIVGIYLIASGRILLWLLPGR